jgi:mono/diheme cytochrome c family protein
MSEYKHRGMVSWSGAVFLVLFNLVGNVQVYGQDANSMPEGAGRDRILNQCTVCHGLSTALVKRVSEDEWRATVNRMVSEFSAPISRNDQTVIIQYLSNHYGEDKTVSIGQETVAKECFRCHNDGMWKDVRTDHDGWTSVVYRMLGRGGVWTEEQIQAMADYLAESYPEGGTQ